MKKVFFVFLLALFSACSFQQFPQLRNDNGKATYTKTGSATRLFLFGNPSVVDIAKENNIKEIISVEKDNYIIVNVTTVKGN